MRAPSRVPIPRPTRPTYSPPPPRPSDRPVRPAPPRVGPQHAPTMVEQPDDRVRLPRGYGVGLWGRVLGVLGAMVYPDTLNEGEQEWLDQFERAYRNRHVPDPWLLDVQMHGPRGFDALIGAGSSIWTPPSVPVEAPQAPILDPEIAPEVWPRVPRYQPQSPELPRPQPRPQRRTRPARPIPDDPMKQPVFTLGMTQTSEGIVIRARQGLRTQRSRPVYRDTKAGRQLIGVLNMMVSKTYGTWSEIQDAVEVLASNTYGVTESGHVISAMALERGNMAAVFQGYVEGDYRLDVAGAVLDMGIESLEDMGYALTYRAQMGLATRLAGDVGYSAMRYTHVGARTLGVENDVRTSWISPTGDYLQSTLDPRRSERVRSLWG